ncbi:hypothetical protein BO82DRAFT_351657 [Aspergillus uvarum CBS 121591]|uniref:Uncharacterized protein n=1 Tax=Aspergillus uvarum CBS 121591 TaxID=1448315 RepID=A0A319CG65_9EURO|nr:hypothetical protein BO82DRAFT_351657 [Aspergillus uvarum CBS 121591]PYH84866.1 hypothetical protein BO82DRAFT_351657 [Aspergillus uvarum CBS 121591]
MLNPNRPRVSLRRICLAGRQQIEWWPLITHWHRTLSKHQICIITADHQRFATLESRNQRVDLRSQEVHPQGVRPPGKYNGVFRPMHANQAHLRRCSKIAFTAVFIWLRIISGWTVLSTRHTRDNEVPIECFAKVGCQIRRRIKSDSIGDPKSHTS